MCSSDLSHHGAVRVSSDMINFQWSWSTSTLGVANLHRSPADTRLTKDTSSSDKVCVGNDNLFSVLNISKEYSRVPTPRILTSVALLLGSYVCTPLTPISVNGSRRPLSPNSSAVIRTMSVAVEPSSNNAEVSTCLPAGAARVMRTILTSTLLSHKGPLTEPASEREAITTCSAGLPDGDFLSHLL